MNNRLDINYIMKRFFFVLALVATIACNRASELRSQANMENAYHFNTYLSTLEIPSKMDFCGERIPLEIPEVKESVEREFYLLLQQPGQVILYLKRSGRYFPMFEKAAKDLGLPDDLKYLAVAESALYMSRSSKSAVGLWQFMEATAKAIGLVVNDYVDERRNPEKSTYCGLKYLKQGYNKHKSWISAAAGYNMGHGGVSENLNFQGAKDYFELFLNEETSRYIFRIVCIKEIMSNPAKYGFKLRSDQCYQPDKVKIVKVETAIPNLANWAKQQGTTYKNVKLLNRWILKRELPAPEKGASYQIAIPQ